MIPDDTDPTPPTPGGGDETADRLDGRVTEWLVQRARDGDRQALDGLYSRLHGRMRGCAVATMGKRASNHPEQVDDVVQEAFTLAFQVLVEDRGFHDDDREGGFRAYLRTIVQRLIFQEVRREARRGRMISFENAFHEPGQDPPVPVEESGPPTKAARREALALVEQALAELSEKDRKVIMLRHLCGMRSAEICAEMAASTAALREGFKTESQVRWTLNRAMARLRRRAGHGAIANYLRPE